MNESVRLIALVAGASARENDPIAHEPEPPHVVIYNADLTVETASDGIGAFLASWEDLEAFRGGDVPVTVTEFVRSLLARREAGEPAGTGLLRPGLVVDVVEIATDRDPVFVATIDRFAVRDPVLAASRRYNLTARQRDVLTLLLGGLGATAVAERLGLSEATVHGYFKQLRQKTGARTLSGMLATLLGWAADAVV